MDMVSCFSSLFKKNVEEVITETNDKKPVRNNRPNVGRRYKQTKSGSAKDAKLNAKHGMTIPFM